MKEIRCSFIDKGERCVNRKESFSPFCSEHREYFTDIDNKTLLEKIAKYVRECIYVTKEKKVAPQRDLTIWGQFTNCVNELFARGYRYEEVLSSVGNIMKTERVFDDIYRQLGKDPKWKKFEKIIADIHVLNAEGAKVEFNDRIEGKTTRQKRQIDVSLRFHHGYYQYLVIIECKDLKGKVPIKEIEAFRTKMEDVRAHKGIMVSSKGFQKGAIEAAKGFNIDLFTLREEIGDWTETIRQNVTRIPFPTDIQFDHPIVDKPLVPHKQSISPQEILLYKDEKSPPVSLAQIEMDISAWAYHKRIPLPCVADVKFESELLTQFPGTNFDTPIYGMKIKLENFEFRLSRRIEIPPKLVKYVYSDITRKKKYEIPIERMSTLKGDKNGGGSNVSN